MLCVCVCVCVCSSVCRSCQWKFTSSICLAPYLATLAGADSIVVSWGFVLTYKAGLVGARWRRRWGGAGNQKVLSWTCAFSLYGCRRRKEENQTANKMHFVKFCVWATVSFGTAQALWIHWKTVSPYFCYCINCLMSKTGVESCQMNGCKWASNQS